MQYVALLRGINVGGKNKLDMKQLKAGFESIGLNSVLTYINSGNILFKSSESDEKVLTQQIERMINRLFELEIPVVLCSYDDLKQICATIPDSYQNNEQMKCDVMFLWEEVDRPEVIDELKPKSEIDRLHYIPKAVIWSIDRDKYNRSSMGKLIGTKLYSKMTVRNVNTTRKLLELMKVRISEG
ncbi:MAG: DUF1697 domain-containing protein [Patescibacteria group bacterium]